MTATRYLQPTADLADRVVLVDDPARALALAQVLCAPTPLMFNHAYGLWGYSGTGLDGAPLTVQATGIGGPSAALVVADLATLGAARFVFVGSVVGAAGVLVVDAAVCADGTSRALGAGERVTPDPRLLAALREAGPAGPVRSCDVLDGIGARDLETAAILQAAVRRGLPAAALLVGDSADDDLVAAAGRAALTALRPVL